MTKIFMMHPDMKSLFPQCPDDWEFVDYSRHRALKSHPIDSEVEVLLSASIEKIDLELLDRLPNLKLIASISAGYSHIDLEECKARDISVTNAPSMNSGDVADLAVTMMMSLLLSVPRNHSFILDGKWVNESAFIRNSIRNTPIGIVGLGSIGIEVAYRLDSFGMDVKWWGPREKRETQFSYVSSLSELAHQCQGLIICCRPNESTNHLIDQTILDELGGKGVIVNVSRGSVIDESTLIDYLKSEKIAGAGLDVFDSEPTSPTMWSNVPNVLLSPHQGGSTYEALFAQANLTQKNIENYIKGNSLLSSVF
ncbi:2-hydroxyacid dehydrogenase [Arenicella sp. 4NH20-0111]|uniref:NAD(P)-dependent oxidoreductase n=1 Tax=Arenicella sp. 4NH20-0111 TaxID=3127648 RepID=UPI00310C3F44